MKILHTSDWHLGQKFLNNNRLDENKQTLSWLLQLVDKEQVDVLIIAGDVFDTMNPPNYARTLYYNFLTKLEKTHCRHTIIIGGNHDSPTTLNAPRELLRTKNIHVVGAAMEKLEEEIIKLKNKKGDVEAVIAAVPFLRDSDIRRSVAGELFEDREKRIRAGIKTHYHQLAEKMLQYEDKNVPIIATGHLFASKATDSKDSKIYVGSLDNIGVKDFPDLFDYVALGHIHKAQMVYYNNRIRYSGSLIPLGFKEIEDTKSVYLLEFDGRNFEKTTIEVPVSRRLIQFRGNYDEVTAELLALEIDKNDLTAWLEVIILTDKIIPNLMEDLKTIVKNKNVQILNFRLENIVKKSLQPIELQDLKTMDELEVFEKRLESVDAEPTEKKKLTTTFKELINWMDERDIE
ncbi:MAG: exonuclease SbcCD subunit D C-terminal domain-containing protein [Saprospiraceae bacterium]